METIIVTLAVLFVIAFATALYFYFGFKGMIKDADKLDEYSKETQLTMRNTIEALKESLYTSQGKVKDTVSELEDCKKQSQIMQENEHRIITSFLLHSTINLYNIIGQLKSIETTIIANDDEIPSELTEIINGIEDMVQQQSKNYTEYALEIMKTKYMPMDNIESILDMEQDEIIKTDKFGK